MTETTATPNTSTARPGRRLAIAAAILMTLSTVAHSLGALVLADQTGALPSDIKQLLTMLWFGAASDFALVAALGWRIALRPMPGARVLLAGLALQPFLVALLQAVILGPSAPTAMLTANGLLFAAAAWRWRDD